MANLSGAPENSTPVQRRNFLNVEIDAVGVGLASAAGPFLPVFLVRLGATNLQVGLLTAMPGLTGLALAIVIGRFLQARRQVVPWFSGARLVVLSGYALTGIVTFFVPPDVAVVAVLIIWAAVTVPQVVVNVTFSVVMNAVAGPEGRYALMSRRWTILGFTASITVAAVGQILDQLGFPFNYQVVFIGLSLGGLISYYFSSQITLPDAEPVESSPGLTRRQQVREYVDLIRGERPFISFITKRFVVLSGSALAAPVFPLFFVRELQASNSWIGAFATVQTAVMLIGYPLWAHLTRQRGPRFVLLCTVLGVALYPALTALTRSVELVTLYAALAGIFQAGLDLVFFDELMKTVPPKYGATFVSFAQFLQQISTVASPLLGTWLADSIGLSGALLCSAALRIAGFLLFARRG
jgi:hypothetical protein